MRIFSLCIFCFLGLCWSCSIFCGQFQRHSMC
jgi:hypothetical protein